MASLDGFESRIEQAFGWFQRIAASKAIEILDAEAGSLLPLEGSPLLPLAEGILTPDIEEGVGGDLVFCVVYDPAAKALLGQRLPTGKGIAGAVLKTGEGQFVNHT